MNHFVLRIIDYTNKLIAKNCNGITLYALLETMPFDKVLDLLSWQRNFRQDIVRVMPELRGLLSEDYVKMCQNNDVKLYKALEAY